MRYVLQTPLFPKAKLPLRFVPFFAWQAEAPPLHDHSTQATDTVSLKRSHQKTDILITPLYLKTSISEVLALIPTLLLPFNLTKAVFNSSLVLIVYKPISYALKRAKLADGVAVYSFDKKSIFVFVLGLLLLVASFAVLIFALNGRVDWFVNRS